MTVCKSSQYWFEVFCQFSDEFLGKQELGICQFCGCAVLCRAVGGLVLKLRISEIKSKSE